MADEPRKKILIRFANLQTPPLTRKMRRDGGHYLNDLQDHVVLTMPISRPMPSIGPRVHELRLSDTSGDWRIVYRADAEEVILVDVFKKTTKQTPKHVIDRCKARLTTYDGI